MLKLTEVLARGRCLAPGRRWHQCKLLAGERVRQKYRRAQLRKIQRREYRNLRKLIPSVRKEEHVDKMTVLEEAVKYIDELHATLLQRFTQGGLAKHVVPAALPIIQLLENGQLPMPPSLQQPVLTHSVHAQQSHPLQQLLSHLYPRQQTVPHQSSSVELSPVSLQCARDSDNLLDRDNLQMNATVDSVNNNA